MKSKQNRHSLNAEGKFWVDQDVCLACNTCQFEATDNFSFDIDIGSSYISKQPENEDELKKVREAIFFCAAEAIIED